MSNEWIPVYNLWLKLEILLRAMYWRKQSITLLERLRAQTLLLYIE